jgi:hypothetical protein
MVKRSASARASSMVLNSLREVVLVSWLGSGMTSGSLGFTLLLYSIENA